MHELHAAQVLMESGGPLAPPCVTDSHLVLSRDGGPREGEGPAPPRASGPERGHGPGHAWRVPRARGQGRVRRPRARDGRRGRHHDRKGGREEGPEAAPRVELADHPDGRHGRLAASEIRGARGMKKHLKRLSAPRSWSTPRKTDFWIVRPSPGPHAMGESVPLGLILRDMLKLCDSAREARHILNNRGVLVDGRRSEERRVGKAGRSRW